MASLWNPGRKIPLGGPFVFTHIPKCGGKWVRRVLEASGHEFVRDVADSHAPAPKGKFPVITFVRHPVTWLASWWAYCERYGWCGDGPLPESFDPRKPYDRMVKITGQFKSGSFEEFAVRLLEQHPGFVTDFFAPYLATADHVGRQESLRADLEALVGSLVDVEPVNVGSNRPKASRAVYEAVSASEDLERLGYIPRGKR